MHYYQYRTIADSDWPAIMRIQREVYHEFHPETEVVMRSKASDSRATCFVATDATTDSGTDVVAYCLAHAYPANCTAVLGTVHPKLAVNTDNLYVHDLAVQRASAGCGIARNLLDHLLAVAQSSGYRTMSLVAVQGAAGFWIKMGFKPSDEVNVNESYAVSATFMTRKI